MIYLIIIVVVAVILALLYIYEFEKQMPGEQEYPQSVNREFIKQWIETMPGTWRPDEYICQFISEQCGIIITEKPKGEADG